MYEFRPGTVTTIGESIPGIFSIPLDLRVEICAADKIFGAKHRCFERRHESWRHQHPNRSLRRCEECPVKPWIIHFQVDLGDCAQDNPAARPGEINHECISVYLSFRV